MFCNGKTNNSNRLAYKKSCLFYKEKTFEKLLILLSLAWVQVQVLFLRKCLRTLTVNTVNC